MMDASRWDLFGEASGVVRRRVRDRRRTRGVRARVPTRKFSRRVRRVPRRVGVRRRAKGDRRRGRRGDRETREDVPGTRARSTRDRTRTRCRRRRYAAIDRAVDDRPSRSTTTSIASSSDASSPRRISPRRRSPQSLGLDVANPRAARAVLAAAAPITSSSLTRVLADIGALEGVHPASAGAAIAGAKVALDVDANDAAVVSVDDVERLVATLAALRDVPRPARRLDPPPPPTLRAYEDHDLLRRRFNEFAAFGASPRDATRLARRLDAAWRRSLVDERVRDDENRSDDEKDRSDDEKDRSMTDSKDRSDDEKDRRRLEGPTRRPAASKD